MAVIKLEKSSQFWLGILGLIVLVMFVINAFNLGNYSGMVFTITAFVLGIILFIEGGIATYFKNEKFKSITLKDFLVWITFAVGATLILHGVFGIKVIADLFPATVVTFVGTTAGLTGVLAGLLVIVHMVSPRMG